MGKTRTISGVGLDQMGRRGGARVIEAVAVRDQSMTGHHAHAHTHAARISARRSECIQGTLGTADVAHPNSVPVQVQRIPEFGVIIGYGIHAAVVLVMVRHSRSNLTSSSLDEWTTGVNRGTLQ